MIIFNADLDNTLIYSYKHNLGSAVRCVEVYKNRAISFMTEYSYEKLKEISGKYLFVPTTTRTIEQYKRIKLPVEPKYSLVCNGGVLLINGKSDYDWYLETLHMIEKSNIEVTKAIDILNKDCNISMEVRYIENLFVFTKSNIPAITERNLKTLLNPKLVNIYSNGSKIYVLPKELNKGNSALRLKNRIGADSIIAAGDSEFDISMLCIADIGVAPKILEPHIAVGRNIYYIEENIFSDAMIKLLTLTERHSLH